jgi:hypothetical protein
MSLPKEGKFVGFSSNSSAVNKTASSPSPIAQKKQSQSEIAKRASLPIAAISSPNDNKTTTDFRTILEEILKENNPIEAFQKMLDNLLKENNDLAKFKKNLYVFMNANPKFMDFYKSEDAAFEDFKNFVNANISTFVIEKNLQRLSLDNLVVFIAMLNAIHPEAKSILEISNVPRILSVLEGKLKEHEQLSKEDSLNQRYLEWLTIVEDKTKNLAELMKSSRKDPISVAILEFIIKNRPDLSDTDKTNLIGTLKQQAQTTPSPASTSLLPPKAPLKK